ncbi:MAG: proteasome subunit alpha [Actinomycetota bacterium]|nr:proteasome subunit alpha [Actinomycetota bacterium]
MSLPFYVPPEQLMKDRAEFARKGIARGKSIVAVEYEDGILLLAENPSGTLHKISEIYDRIAFAGVGRYNEFETLRVAGIRHADIKGYAYGRPDVNAKGLANAYSQTLGNIFTHEIKPYEVEILVVEVGDEPSGNRLFRVLYDGTVYDERRFCAIGGQAEALVNRLNERYQPRLGLHQGVQVVARVFEELENRSIPPEEWEAAILDRSLGRRAFRRLETQEIAAGA